VGRDPAEITTTRLGTLVLTDDADETARVRGFLSGLAGAEFDEQFTVGEADEVVRAVEALIGAGIDTPIFNMPLSDAATVAKAGELLTKNFA
jgi:hypothetical protein